MPLRSESTENEVARRQLQQTSPVTILQDLIGRMVPSVGQNNSSIDAWRANILQRMLASGGYPTDNWGNNSTYGQPAAPYTSAKAFGSLAP